MDQGWQGASPRSADLRAELREFLAAERARGGFDPAAGSFARPDRGFSARLGARRWIAPGWPVAYGGRGGDAVADHRAIGEELLAAGAPVRFHWAAERLAGPVILHHGTEAQRLEVLPRIAAGRLAFCIGDRPGIAAVPEPGGWRLGGRLAAVADAMGAARMLLRAALPAPAAGGSAPQARFILDMALPGVRARPLPLGPGLAEVVLEDVFLAEDRMVGLPGPLPAAAPVEPDVWLREFHLVAGLAGHPASDAALGLLVARIAARRALGWSGELGSGPRLRLLAAAAAAQLPAAVRRAVPEAALAASPAGPGFPAALAAALPPPAPPGVALGLAAMQAPVKRPGLPPEAKAVARVFAAAKLEAARMQMAAGGLPALWSELEEAGLARPGLPRKQGGLGLPMARLLALARVVGAAAAPVPLADAALGQWALQAAGLAAPLGLLAVGPVLPGDAARLEGRRLSGVLHRIPWARHASALLVVAEGCCVLAGRPAVIGEATNAAGEPRDTVRLDAMPVLAIGRPGRGPDAAGLLGLGALCRAAALVGAMERLEELLRGLAQARLEGARPIAIQPEVRLALGLASAELAAARAVLAEGVLAGPAAVVQAGVAAEAMLAAVATIAGADAAPLLPWVSRLLAWREEFGGEAHWAGHIGALARAAGPGGLWPLLADAGRMPGTKEGEAP